MDRTSTSSLKDRQEIIGLLRWAIRSLISTLIIACVLFIAAGRIDWIQAWVLLGLTIIFHLLTAALLIPKNPALLADRARAQTFVYGWDRALTLLGVLLLPQLTWLTAGLDERFNWSPEFATGIMVTAAAVMLISNLLVIWSMYSNAFFTGTVQVKENDNHTVVSSGPYRYIRHPGYLGFIIYMLAAPLLLASLWAFIPATLTALLFIVRTQLEDHTLWVELAGYKEYSHKTRFRLVPGIW